MIRLLQKPVKETLIVNDPTTANNLEYDQAIRAIEIALAVINSHTITVQ